MKDDSSAHQYTDTQKLFDFAFDNFSIYPIADLETEQTLNESPMFTRYNSLLSKATTPIVTDEKGYLVLPNTASFEDAQKEVTFFPSDASGNLSSSNIIGTISYTYHDKYVGGADILYNSVENTELIHSEPEIKNPTTDLDVASPLKSGGSLRPIIIGGIVGFFVLVIVLYFIIVERPRLKRRSAYYKKRSYRKAHRDEDFLDL
jgi:hypothetical protein